MDILITADRTFLKPLATLVYSISKNSKKKRTNVFYYPYVYQDRLSEKEKHFLLSKIRKNDTIVFFEVPTTCAFEVDKNDRGWNYQVWLKLTCLFYLPVKIKKLLYIDSDCVVDGSLDELYTLDLKDSVMAGINEQLNNNEKLKRMGVPENNIYVCGGVLLINPSRFVEIFQNVNTLLSSFLSLPFNPVLNEQDFINYYFRDELVVIADRKFMFFTKWYKKQKDEEVLIYHFAGLQKPWECYDFVSSIKLFLKYWKYGIHTFGFSRFLIICVKALWCKLHKMVLKNE